MNAQPRLWLAIRFSDLPLTALKIEDTEKPVVVIKKKRVIFANILAKDAGAQLNMDITTAQLLSGCEVVERDEEKELLVLHKLSEQLYQFSPYIERYCSDDIAQCALLLEISSCLKLFGGLKAISQKIAAHVSQTPYSFILGLAHSSQAAWYLSFATYEIEGNETKELFIERLHKLPITLIDNSKAVEALEKTGFRTFGDLAKQIKVKSISSFKKRIGAAFTDVLCDVFDIDQNFSQNSLFEKPREVYQPDEWFEDEIQFEYPVTLVDLLKPAIEMLLQGLTDYLRKRQQQCQYIEWRISDIYRNKEFINVNSDTPQTHWQLLYDLTLIQFDNKELPFEVDTMKLVCHHTMPLQHRSHVLDFDQTKRRKRSLQDFAITIAKLKARLGDAAVYKIGYRDSRVPELTNIIVALADRCNQELPEVHLKALRPTWLLTKPELMEERSHRLFWHGYVAPVVGPERIIGNWWEEPVARDYYLATRHDNLPMWIFFNLYDKQWYVHGVFA